MIIENLSNGIEVIRNFDWDMTRRKLCIFMPNYHDERLCRLSLESIQTVVPKEDYIIIVGNDGEHVPFEGIDNVYYLTLNKPDKKMRNGAFIRNYVLKNCQSDLFFQKDGEVVMLGDFIKSCIDADGPWRAGTIYVLDDNQTNKFLETRQPTFTSKTPTKSIECFFPERVEEVKNIIVKAAGGVNLSTYFHYAYCVKTKTLQDINGYDEDFFYYGFEDSDMFCRLYHLGHKLNPKHDITAVHLCHPRPQLTNDINVMSGHFQNKDPKHSVRNPNGWGDGL